MLPWGTCDSKVLKGGTFKGQDRLERDTAALAAKKATQKVAPAVVSPPVVSPPP